MSSARAAVPEGGKSACERVEKGGIEKHVYSILTREKGAPVGKKDSTGERKGGVANGRRIPAKNVI